MRKSGNALEMSAAASLQSVTREATLPFGILQGVVDRGRAQVSYESKKAVFVVGRLVGVPSGQGHGPPAPFDRHKERTSPIVGRVRKHHRTLPVRRCVIG